MTESAPEAELKQKCNAFMLLHIDARTIQVVPVCLNFLRFKKHGKAEMKANIYSCLFLINGVKSCNFVPLGVYQGSHWLTSDNITCLLRQREQLANLVNAFRPLVSQLFLENKYIHQSNKEQGRETHHTAFTIRKCPVSG